MSSAIHKNQTIWSCPCVEVTEMSAPDECVCSFLADTCKLGQGRGKIQDVSAACVPWEQFHRLRNVCQTWRLPLRPEFQDNFSQKDWREYLSPQSVKCFGGVCVCVCVLVCVHVCMCVCVCTTFKSLQPCPTLCNPMNCSPPGSSVHGIL